MKDVVLLAAFEQAKERQKLKAEIVKLLVEHNVCDTGKDLLDLSESIYLWIQKELAVPAPQA